MTNIKNPDHNSRKLNHNYELQLQICWLPVAKNHQFIISHKYSITEFSVVLVSHTWDEHTKYVGRDNNVLSVCFVCMVT